MDVIEIPRVDNVKLSRLAFSEIDGILDQLIEHKIECSICLTSHHLIISPKTGQGNQSDEEIWVS